MDGEGNVPTGRHLTNHVNIISRSAQRLCSTTHLQGRFRFPSQEETGGRIGRSENLHRAEKFTVFSGDRYDGHRQIDRSPVDGMVDGAEVFNPIKAGFEGKGQGARILTVDPTGGEAASSPNRLPFFVAEQAAGRMVDVAEGPLAIEHDDGIIELIDDVEPRPTENVSRDLIHALITAHGS